MHNCQISKPIKQYKNAIKTTFVLQIIFVSVKLDGILTLDWVYLFWYTDYEAYVGELVYFNSGFIFDHIYIHYYQLSSHRREMQCHRMYNSSTVFISIWVFFIITGYTFTVAMCVLSILQFISNKSTPFQILIYPLYYLPFYIAIFSMLFYKYTNYIEQNQIEQQLHNPIELAKIALENFKANIPTGYPQSYLFPKYIVNA